MTVGDLLQPMVQWCKVPTPAKAGDTHVVRFYVLPGDWPTQSLYYYGELAYSDGTGLVDYRFGGAALCGVDPRYPHTPVPGFNEWFARVNIAVFRHGGGTIGLTYADWDNLTYSPGTSLRTVEADLVPRGEGWLDFEDAGMTSQLHFKASTLHG